MQDQHFRLLVCDGLCRGDDVVYQRIKKVVKKVAADLTSDHENLPIRHPRQYWEKFAKQRANAVVLTEIFNSKVVAGLSEPRLTRDNEVKAVSSTAIHMAKSTTGIKRSH